MADRLVVRDIVNGQVVLRPPREGEVERLLADRDTRDLVTTVPEAEFANLQRQALLQQVTQDQPVGAFLGGAANAMTMGAASVLQRSMNPEGADLAAARADVNQGANLTGSIVGSLLPALATGGTGEALSAATAPGMSMAAGRAAGTQLTELLIQRGLNETAARGLGLVGEATIDATLSGGMASIEQDLVHNQPIDYERMASSAGMSGILGLGIGGLGAAGSLMGGAARGLTNRFAGRTAQRMEQSGLEHAAAVMRGEIPANTGMLDRAVDFLSERMGSSTPESRALADPAVRQLAQDSFNHVDDLIRNVSEHSDNLLRLSDEVSPTAAQRSRLFDGLLPNDSASWSVAATHAAGTLDNISGSLRALAATSADSVTAGALERVAGNLDLATNRGLGGQNVSPARAFRTLDEAQTVLSRRPRGVTPAAEEALDQASRNVQAALERPEAFGDAAVAQRNLRQATEAYRAASGEVVRDLGGSTPSGRAIDPAKVRSLFLDSVNPRGDRRMANLEAFLDAGGNYQRQLAQHYRIPGLKSSTLDELSQEIRRNLAEGETRIQAVNMASRGLRRERGEAGFGIVAGLSGGSVGAGLGALAGGPLGAGVGSAVGSGATMLLGAALRPISFRMQMGRIRAAITGSASREASAFSRLRSALGGRSPLIAAASTGARRLAGTTAQLRSAESRKKEYHRLVKEIQEIAANPEALAARLEVTTSDLAEIPGMAEHVASAGVRGLQYMASVLPPAEEPTPFGHLYDLDPSQTEMDIFIARHEALEDPFRIVERAANASLIPQEVEAVSVVYPEIYREIQSQTAEVIGSLDTLPPYQMRTQVGLLLQVPSDPTLDPRFIQQLQSRYAQTAQQFQSNVGMTRQMSRQTADSHYSETQELNLRL